MLSKVFFQQVKKWQRYLKNPRALKIHFLIFSKTLSSYVQATDSIINHFLGHSVDSKVIPTTLFLHTHQDDIIKINISSQFLSKFTFRFLNTFVFLCLTKMLALTEI